jgi:hypothetical protein
MNRITSLTTNAAGAAAAMRLTVVVHVVLGGLQRRARNRERGDVPGWVLITLMTAGLVTILWKLAGDQLAALFTQAISSVTGP